MQKAVFFFVFFVFLVSPTRENLKAESRERERERERDQYIECNRKKIIKLCIIYPQCNQTKSKLLNTQDQKNIGSIRPRWELIKSVLSPTNHMWHRNFVSVKMHAFEMTWRSENSPLEREKKTKTKERLKLVWLQREKEKKQVMGFLSFVQII